MMHLFRSRIARASLALAMVAPLSLGAESALFENCFKMVFGSREGCTIVEHKDTWNLANPLHGTFHADCTVSQLGHINYGGAE